MVGLPLWAFKKIGRWVREGEDVEDCAANPTRRQGSTPAGPRRAFSLQHQRGAVAKRREPGPRSARGRPNHSRFSNPLPLSVAPYFFRRSY
jgi:hypothetical protein